MPQFDKKIHPARARLEAVGREWPGLWTACEIVRSTYDPPDGLYLGDFLGGSMVIEAASMTGLPMSVDDLRQLAPLEVVRLVVPLVTMATWRMTQGIYRIDPAVYAELVSTPVSGDIPAEILQRLPEWCIYVETPGLSVVRIDGRGRADLRGVFARLDQDQGAPSLVLTLDLPAADHLESQAIALRGTVDQSVTAGLLAWGYARPDIIAAVREYVDPILNLLLYICSQGGDITGRRGQPGNPAPKRTRRDGWRIFPADGPAVWDVGTRMGAALRAAYAAEQTGQNAGGENAGPRGHIRRAHWHGFRSGPRIDPDGLPIPAEKRRFDLRWMPPIPVNLPDVDGLPSVIRPVG